MNASVVEQSTVWAIVLIVVLPIVIIGIGEVEERLRQRDSAFTRPVALLRTWAIPLFAAWVLLRSLFGISDTTLVIRVLGTGVVISLAAVALGVLRILLDQLGGRSTDSGRRAPQLLLALPRVGLLLVTIWLLLDTVWGVDLSAALTALGVTSLVVSFALQDTLSGLASGFLLLFDAPFQPGDWIEWGDDEEGRVVDINWRSSRIVNRNGDLMVVPNAALAAATIINFDQPTRIHRVVVPVQVDYSNPPTLAIEMLLDAARSTRHVLSEPAPTIKVVQVDDPLMGYQAQMWIDDYSLAPQVASEFGALVWYQSHRHDVPLPSPAYNLYMYDGPTVTAESKPDTAEIRRRLQVSPLMAQLSDAALDRLASGGRAERFSRGEVILGEAHATRELRIVWAGTARITVDDQSGNSLGEIELGVGEVFGLLSRGAAWARTPQVIASTDCELVLVDETVAGEVISQNPALATALNQITATRRRRIERWLESLGDDVAPDEPDPDTVSTDQDETP